MTPILEAKNLCKSFGGVEALSELNLQVREREIVGLIGPNGAGKTTFFNVITGFHPPTSGGILFKGRDITGWKPHRIAHAGLIRTFQATTLFKEMTVMENMLLGFHMQYRSGPFGELFRTKKQRQELRSIRERILEILDFMGLVDFRNEMVKNLPYGHQRALGVSLALAADPEMLLLDESVTGMNAEEIAVMMDHIKRISEEKKIAVMVVEHNMRVVMGICNRIIVLNFGTKIAEGSPEEIKSNKMVIEAYLGSEEG
ncbi:MAG: ABC transporter ATP-binding protein [Pseudomonadota bacterium]